MTDTSSKEDWKLMNLIVQKRVKEFRCIDCGTKLTDTPGYCSTGIFECTCGTILSPTVYTEDELNEAKYESINNHRIKHR